MTINLVRSDSLYKGVPYAYASMAPRGSLIFTAGACRLDDRGEVVGVGDVRAQASLAVANLATVLAESGATLADVLKTTVFVASTERADLVAAWDVVSAAFGEHDAPSTLFGVTVLGWPDQMVEIEAVAVVTAVSGELTGRRRSRPSRPRPAGGVVRASRSPGCRASGRPGRGTRLPRCPKTPG